ncbi:MAG: tetratricopeptide repeat protein [Elusimicrobia bacterium]|nr:tetratricopeptide repeat protein [Elusimicrobiota bacterium]
MRKENVLIKLEKAEKLINDEKPLGAAVLLKKTKPPVFLKAEYHLLLAKAWQTAGYFKKALENYKIGSSFSDDPTTRLSRLKAGLKKTSSAYGATSGWWDDPVNTVSAAIDMAACWRSLGKLPKALRFSNLALKLSKKHRVYTEEAEMEYALVLRLGGDFKNAKIKFDLLFNHYIQKKDYAACSFICWALGGIYRLEGLYAKSIDAFRKAEQYAVKSGDKFARGYALFGQGGVLRVGGKMNESLTAYKKAKKIFSFSQDIFGKAYSECGYANVLRQKGDLPLAMKGYLKARKLYTEIDDDADLGFVEWGIGEILKRSGQFEAALKSFKAARDLFKGNCEPRGEILVKLSTAQTLHLLGQGKSADKIFDDAVELARKHKLKTYMEVFT